MCGIVGYIGNADAATVIINGLRRLEYRGYDSAVSMLSKTLLISTRKFNKLPSSAIEIRSSVAATSSSPSPSPAKPPIRLPQLEKRIKRVLSS